MSDEQIILNYYLFISLLEKKNVEEKKSNVLRCLDQGADVNAVDRNQRNNTPLHIAVERDEIVIVQLLLAKGAVFNVLNQDYKTPLDTARELQTTSGKQIFQLLNDRWKQPRIAAIGEPFHQNKSLLISRARNYEIKLLSLVLLRALNDNDIEDFKLGTNQYCAGGPEDLCLRLKVKGQDKPIIIFLEAITYLKARSKTYREYKGPFSILKYFNSFNEIKNNFRPNNINLMFDGEFRDTETYLIFYTPIKDYFPHKLVTRTKPSPKVHELITTTVIGEALQFDYEESDLKSLTKMTIEDQIRNLANIFLYCIMEIKDIPEDLMSNEYIARYHYVLSQDVISVSDIHEIKVNKEIKQIRHGTFRPEFFTSSSGHVLYLREILYNKVSSTYCDPASMEHDAIVHLFQDIFQNPNAINISRVIGKLAIYKTNKLEIIETSYLTNQFNKKETVLENIRDGLSKLEVQPETIREAVWLKLRGTTFTLPSQFGNLDMYFRGNENEIKINIKKLVQNLLLIFKEYNESKVVEINDSTANNRKLIKRRLTDEEGIESAVGNLLVLDEDTKMFKFDVDMELPKYSKAVLSELLLYINKEELRKYKLNIEIVHFPKYHFDEDWHDKSEVKEFLNKLWFYTNQAEVHEIETILKSEINKYYNNQTRNKKTLFKIHTNAIYLEALDTILKWWMTQGSSYLDKKSQFFKRAKDTVIDSPLLTVLNYMFIQKLQKLDITFNQTAVDSLRLQQMKSRHNIKTESIIFTALKIKQYFQEEDEFTFIEFENILSISVYDYNYLLRDLRVTKIKYLIIIYEEIKYPEEHAKTKLKEVMDAFIGRSIVIVTKHNLADENGTFEGENFVSVSDCNNYLINLTEDSQKRIIENSEVVLQDDEISIKPTIRWTSENS